MEESLFAWMVERVKKAERYEQALKDIAEDNGTPSATIAAKALEAE